MADGACLTTFVPSTPVAPALRRHTARLSPPRPDVRLATSASLLRSLSPKSIPDVLMSLFNKSKPVSKEETPAEPPLPGNRGVVLVTGAAGRTGGRVVERLLGVASRIVAQVDASFDESSREWGSRPEVTLLRGELNTRTGALEVAAAARAAGVGSVVFAATGGVKECASVENAAVGTLARELSLTLGGTATGDTKALFDFMDPQSASAAASKFAPVDDVVMGGRSASSLSLTSDAEGSFARFGGIVTTNGGGGFAQTRAPLGDGAGADLSGFDGLMLRVRGAGRGRTYKLSLKDNLVPDGAYQVSFDVTGGGNWQTVRIPFDDFVPMRRGKPQFADGRQLYASKLDTSRVLTVGIVLSLVGDGLVKVAGGREREGPFELDVRSISAYVAGPPRFVLLSSAAVTRPFWGPDRLAVDGAAADIPIVKLNPGGILGHKLAGENGLRRSDVSWCVVRSIGLSDEAEAGRRLKFAQGDVMAGTMSRDDVVRGAIAALRAPSAAFRTFEMGGVPGTTGTGEDVGDEVFGRLLADGVDAYYPEETAAL